RSGVTPVLEDASTQPGCRNAARRCSWLLAAETGQRRHRLLRVTREHRDLDTAHLEVRGVLDLDRPAPVAVREARATVAPAVGRAWRRETQLGEHVCGHPSGERAFAQCLETADLATGRARQREQGERDD